MKEPTTRANDTDYENFSEKLDEEHLELVALAGTIYSDYDETKENGLVLEVLQKGYILKDKVIRPAMVRVNNL